MSTIVRATDAQKVEHLKTNPAYQLYGYVVISGLLCTIEDLRPDHSDVSYKICAPKGYRFEQHGLHTLMCVSHADVKEQIKGATLGKCDRPCGWCGAGVID